MTEKGRASRVAELVREETAKLLMKGIKDPRIGFVSVMSVRMSSDLRYANVYVSLYGSESERKSSLVGLRNSAGWIRREIGKHLRMRHTPEVRFFPDDTLDTVYHLEEVFQEIHEDQQHTPMLELSLEEAAAELDRADSLLLITHVHPDGDAIGSMLGLCHMLKARGKTRIAMAIDGDIPRIYKSLPGAKSILGADDDRPFYDLAVMLDCSSFDRIGALGEWIEPGKRLLVLDHHTGPGPHGASGHIDTSCAATGELILMLFDAAGVELSPAAAHCLYVAQATDTGGYRFSNTTDRSHDMAARFLRAGVDAGAVNREVLGVVSRPKFELLRRVLNRVEITCSGALASSWVTRGDITEVQGLQEDTDGLINHLIQVEGVRVAALFSALEPDTTKVSMRAAPDFDCAAFLNDFGGGGHKAAAGATLDMPLAGAQSTVLEALVRALSAVAERPEGGE